jgi:hypothetical protein
MLVWTAFEGEDCAQGGLMHFIIDLPLEECRYRLRECKSVGNLFFGDTEIESVLRGKKVHFIVKRTQRSKSSFRYTVMQMTGVLTPINDNQTEVAAYIELCLMGYVNIVLTIVLFAIAFFLLLYGSPGYLFAPFMLLGFVAYDRHMLLRVMNKLKSA